MRWVFVMAFAFVVGTAETPALAFDSGTSGFSLAEPEADAPDMDLWVLHPAPPPSPMKMVINLHAQRAYIYRDGVRVGTTTISSGKRGYRTPTGTFTVLQKQRFHRSNKYDNAPMPYMQRLSWSGLAMHGGHVPGFPASHGCIRLPQSFAGWLYRQPTMGMTVLIANSGPTEETAIASRGQSTRTKPEVNRPPWQPDDPSARPERVPDGAADDQAVANPDDGPDYGNGNRRPAPLEEERNRGQDHGQDDPDRTSGIPPPDPAPPPSS